MKFLYPFLSLLLLLNPGLAQLSITATGSAFVIDFDNTRNGVNNGQFAAAATYATAAPAAGQLDRGAFQVSTAAGTGFNWPGTVTDLTGGLGTSTGGVTSGGTYAFSDNGGVNRLLGFQPTGTIYTPGAIILRIQNNSGTVATGFDVGYRGLYLNDQQRENSLQGYYSLDGSTWVALPGSFNFNTPAAATIGATWVAGTYSASVALLSIPNGAFLYIKWVTDDVSGTGSRDEIGLDDISVTLQGGACTTAPSLNATGLAVSAATESSLSLSWTNGDGQARILVARSGAAVTAIPVNNATYSADSRFGLGTDLGGGQYAVYNGSGNATTLTDLAPGQVYHFALFEYNCSPGSERYLTPGTAGTASSLPANATNFTVGCVTATTVQLSWNLPTGNFDGVLIFVRESGVPADPIADETAYTGANANFGVAPVYGARGSLVYKGTGNSVTITGLNPDSTYTFKLFTYLNSSNTRWSTGTQRTVTAEFNPVSGLSALPGNGQATVSWTNPQTGCFDEILVVINLAPGIGFTPSGNGSAYTANPFYFGPNQVVYKGNGTSVTVSNLTNGVTYYFEVFVRRGSTWSRARETSATPGIELYPGDLLILGFDNNVNGGIDKIVLTNLVDLPTGTSFSIANATYELFAGANVRTEKWYSADGAGTNAVSSQRITYLGATAIARGSVICLELPTTLGTPISTLAVNGSALNAGTDFVAVEDAITNGVVNFSTSGPDPIFLVQGAWVINPDHALLNGRVLGGIQDGATWYQVSDDLRNLTPGADMRRSRIPPSIRCFAIQGRTNTGTYFTSYTGTRTGTKRALISNITDFTANWTGGNGDGSDNLPVNVCTSTFTFTGNTTPGLWVGDADNNWFNCANWDNFEVPDETVDVTVAGGTFEANISHLAPFSDEFSDTARCNNLSLTGPQKVGLSGSVQNVLLVNGNLSLSGQGRLDMDDGADATDDGQLLLYGDWSNQVGPNAFEEGNGLVRLLGSRNPQRIAATGGEAFFDLEVNKSAGEVLLVSNVGIDVSFTNDNVNDGQLWLSQGKVNALGNRMTVHSHNANAIAAFGPDAYLYGGTLRRAIEGNSSFSFPIGTAFFYELGRVTFTSAGTGSATFLDASFDVITGAQPNFNEGPYVYIELLDAGLWTLTPNAAFTGTYNLFLQETGYSNGGAPAYTITRRSNSAAAWGTLGTPGPWTDNGTEVTSIRNGLNAFSEFAIARPLALPLENLDFQARKENEGVHLSWELQSPVPLAHLLLRRSPDGQFFSDLQYLPASETGESRDLSPLPGDNYYQLLFFDVEGNVRPSAVRRVWFDLQESVQTSQAPFLYPNPSTGKVFLQGVQPTASPLHFTLFSPDGRKVAEQVFSQEEGPFIREIDLSHLPGGVYAYRIQLSQGVYAGKVVLVGE